jgi:poly(A) polymerase
LRADVGEVDELLADWWQEFSIADEPSREDLLQQARTVAPQDAATKKRRRRRKPTQAQRDNPAE